MDPPADIFDYGLPTRKRLPNLDFPATPPRVMPHANNPSPPRVAPPALPIPPASRVEPPNVPASRTQSKNPNNHSVAQESLLTCATVAKMNLPPKQLFSRRFLAEIINSVLNEETGKLMEYRHIMKIPNITNSTQHPTAKNWGVSPNECQENRKAPTPYIS